MKQFETSWKDGYEYMERSYDTQLKKSVVSRINLRFEWYTENSTGLYSSILDSNIKLEKKQGNAKEGRGNYGFLDPLYRNIRDNHWDKDAYNKSPRVWWLDIETRVSRSYKNKYFSDSEKITIRKKS
jgi:hypothetical protein